jgi:hypothetical protein
MACPLHHATRVTLKIEKTLGERCTTIKLMGRIRAEHLEELKTQITASLLKIVLEFGKVSLVDADAVRFLITCESEGIQLLNCSPTYASGLSGNGKAPSKSNHPRQRRYLGIISSLLFEFWLAV